MGAQLTGEAAAVAGATAGAGEGAAPKPAPETLYLIDGYAAIFRAYYAIRRPLHSPVTGEPTQAVLVFAQMLLKLFTQFQPDYVAVALDAPGRTFRDELYAQYAPDGTRPPEGLSLPGGPPAEAPEGAPAEAPPVRGPARGYKGNRAATPDPLHRQIPRIVELLRLFGIPVISKAGLEADDVIATLTDRILQDPARGNVHVRIVSRDKDLEQLLGDRVTLFDIHTGVITDVASLRERKGISPAQVVDVLALTGDAVDNIPGVDGIGPRTAAKLLQQFGSLEGVLENLDQVRGWWRENLEKARPYLGLSRRLVTLERDPDIAFSLEAARVRPLPAADLLGLFDELGFNRLKQQLMRLVVHLPREGKKP